MTEITIPGWKTFQYEEVWEVVEMRDNCIYKTKTTGEYIKNGEKHNLPDNFITSPVSAFLTMQNTVTLPLWKENKQ